MKLSSSRGPGRGLFLDPDYFDFYILKISDEQFEPFFEIKKNSKFFNHTVYLHHTTNLYYRKSTIWPFEVSFESGEFETNFSRYDIELIYRQHFMRNLAILNNAWSKIWLIINITFVCKLQSPFYANCSVSDVKIIIFASHTCSKKYQGRFSSRMSTSKSTD